MEKDPARLSMTPSAWAKLPPRSASIEELLKLAGGAPTKQSGMCNSCDSKISDQWCTAGSEQGSMTELSHLAEYDAAYIRPSELAAILVWLNSAKK